MGQPNQLAGMASRTARVQVSIPANNVMATTFRSLLKNLGHPSADGVLGFKVLGLNSDGSNRAAFIVSSPRPGSDSSVVPTTAVATDFTTHGQYVAAGADYGEPATADADSFVQSTTGTGFTAVMVIWS